MRRHLSPLFVLTALASLASAATLVACGDAGSAGNDPGEGVAADEIRDGRCVAARRYDAFLEEGTCTNIVATRGTWVAESLFPDAPPAVRATSCAYHWEGAAVIDHAAIFDLPHTSVLSPVCGAARDAVSATVELEEAPYWETTIMGGAAGCDVCGKLRKDKAWVILPPDRELIGKVQVPYLRTGTIGTGESGIAFQLGAIPPGVRAVSIALPPAPPGKTYATSGIVVF